MTPVNFRASLSTSSSLPDSTFANMYAVIKIERHFVLFPFLVGHARSVFVFEWVCEFVTAFWACAVG